MKQTRSITESRRGGVKSKGIQYSYISQYGKEIIDFELNTMRDEKVQIAVRVSCANKLLDKILADLKASEDRMNVNIRYPVIWYPKKIDEHTTETTRISGGGLAK